MPEPGSDRNASAIQAYRSRGRSCGTAANRSDDRAKRAAQSDGVLAQLTRHVGGDSLVGSRRGRKHRGARRKSQQRPGQPLLVGAEVEAPIGDTVRLVNDQQPALAE
jgi:hypothetical protein